MYKIIERFGLENFFIDFSSYWKNFGGLSHKFMLEEKYSIF